MDRIEKNEENAFSDFSKILFLKLLEEKWDVSGKTPPYSYQFYELASTPKGQADRVQTAIKSMIKKIKDQTKFGDVLLFLESILSFHLLRYFANNICAHFFMLKIS